MNVISASMLRRVVGAGARRPLGFRSYSTPPPPIDSTPEDNVPYISRQYLPPRGWTDIQQRRNWGDPLHKHDELLSMWGPDIPPPGVTPQMALRHFSVAVLAFITAGYIISISVPDRPTVHRTYPFDGLVRELGGLGVNKARPEEGTGEEED